MRGFTLIEMLVVMGIIAMMAVLTGVNLLNSQRSVEKTAVVEQVVADVRSQQSKAMAGESSGASFGVHFNDDNYALFTGNSYNPNDTSNFVVNLENNIILSTTFASGNIFFTPVSGEVTNYVAGSDTFTVIDATDNSIHLLHVNKYGVVDSET